MLRKNGRSALAGREERTFVVRFSGETGSVASAEVPMEVLVAFPGHDSAQPSRERDPPGLRPEQSTSLQSQRHLALHNCGFPGQAGCRLQLVRREASRQEKEGRPPHTC